ncbi:hypothetical protein ACEWY4_001020 [Coilia grayii]|uniref:B30.2/SPRY domain-containing protein n=1 Tax=Coilia grayii TaxID=363190 RepID=A0ABD1KYB0_9TELE
MLVGLLCVVLLIVTGLCIKARAHRNHQNYQMSLQYFNLQSSYNVTAEERDNLQLRLCKLVNVTLDFDTADLFLIRTADIEQVFGVIDIQAKPNLMQFILGKHGFSSGRFYYEVQVKGETMWTVGVVEEIDSRQNMTFLHCCVWTITLRYGAYVALRDGVDLVHFKPMQTLDRVGVFVDIEAKLVSFYNADHWDLLHSFKHAQLNDTIYPILSPWLVKGGRNNAPLVITTPVDCMPSRDA